MTSILIQLDDGTVRALNRVAPPKSRRRAEFIREAIRRAVRDAEYSAMRRAYLERPDSESEADAWANSEEYKR